MEKLVAYVFMLFAACVTSHVVREKLYEPTKACQVYHFDAWKSLAESETNKVKSIDKSKMKFDIDVRQLDEEYFLLHNSSLKEGQLINFYFDLYKPKKGTALTSGVEVTKDQIVPLTKAERPKLRMTTGDSDEIEYTLNLIRVRLPMEIYNEEIHTPNFVEMILYFSATHNPRHQILVEYPVYEAVEPGIIADPDIGAFLKRLSQDRKARKHAIVQDLQMLKSALESVARNDTQVYQSGWFTERFVILTPCEYIETNVFEDLFDRHHVRLRTVINP